jgi:transcriptional regulator with XRE-family HTH domain
MQTSHSKSDDPKFKAAFARAMLRSAFKSMFWAVISDRKKSGFTLVSLAKATGSSKHEVSRWFNGDPNWTLNTIASIAHALKLTIKVEAIDEHGNVYGSSGLVAKQNSIATSDVRQDPVNITRAPPGAVINSDIASTQAA